MMIYDIYIYTYTFRTSQHETHTETPVGRGPPFAAASVFAKPRGSGSGTLLRDTRQRGGLPATSKPFAT